jgi:hypothetical protein
VIINKCRICGGALFTEPLLQYEGSPKSAQGFLNATSELDELVNLTINQCAMCGVVQHNHEPVSYYKEVIRAVAFSPQMGEFRLAQLGDWIARNNLQNKKMFNYIKIAI